MKSEKIISTMRSLFRYFKLTHSMTPVQILIETEQELLESRMRELSADEIMSLVESWPKYFKEQLVDSEIQTEEALAEVEKEILSLN